MQSHVPLRTVVHSHAQSKEAVELAVLVLITYESFSYESRSQGIKGQRIRLMGSQLFAPTLYH
jgi:hypothetical protein